jgi:hypothetical protein
MRLSYFSGWYLVVSNLCCFSTMHGMIG